ncbi:MAG TPA: hypothetical protein VD993_16490 [Chitinophagaceae bacterium]|nr:hypothetical protein [Chitinophagaceae bacterium]
MKQLQGTVLALKPSAAALAILLLLSFSLSSCKKDKAYQQPTPTIEKYLVINFSNVTIPIAQVDSATVILTKQGSNTPTFRRFDKGSQSLNLLMDDNSSGNWTADLYVYSRKPDGSVRLFTRSIGFSLPLAVNLNLVGPTGANDGLWNE